MIVFAEPDERPFLSPLGRTSPVVKLGVAIAWLIGLALTLDPRPPLLLAVVALGVGLTLGRIPPARLAAAYAPLLGAALGIGLFNALFSGSNADPALAELVRLGPFRVTEAAAGAGLGLGLRVVAIAATGVVFGLTTDPTHFVDALVVQAHRPERFAYGALAAYQAIPRLADDLATLRQARRIRGLPGSWHPRILVGLLVLAVRHADRLALAMDARGFGLRRRTLYRPLAWGAPDLALAAGGVALLGVALGLAVG